MRFRKKLVVIEAIQYKDTLEKTLKEIKDFCKTSKYLGSEGHYYLIIPTLEGKMRASKGDWIIKGVKGEFYPCKPDIFEATYEPVIEDAV
jgi:hypothetical protein